MFNPQHSDTAVLIPAAGVGERMGLGPKALVELNGKPLVHWVTQKALHIANEVIVSAPAELVNEFSSLCPDCTIIVGGATRQESILKLSARTNRKFIIIQDVARPFFSLELMEAVLSKARDIGCAGAFLTPNIPIAVITNNVVTQSYRANEVGIFQAPQAFLRTELEDVLRLSVKHDWIEQSTLQLMLRANRAVGTVLGESTNIKLTTADDWHYAQLLTGLL